MGRPAKPIGLTKGHRTKDEIEKRQEIENRTRGKNVDLKPPKDMPADQKKYFRFFVKELKDAEILGKIDVPLLTNASRCFARFDEVEKAIDRDPDMIFAKEVSATQDRLFKQSVRYMNELGLSPQSRAKLGTISQEKAEKTTTIMDLLADDDE